MSGSYQQVIICGNLGSDPETRMIANSQTMVANISVATSERWKNKQTGNMEERTEWHKVVAFGKLAEIIAQYPKKGDKLLITGQLRTRKWQDQTGQDKYTTEIVAKDMVMLGGSQSASTGQQAPAMPRHAGGQQNAQAATQGPSGLLDDEIPF